MANRKGYIQGKSRISIYLSIYLIEESYQIYLFSYSSFQRTRLSR